MIELALAREHLKADAEDIEDALIQQYIDSAVSICEGYCNRKFYEDAAEQVIDFDAAVAELKLAKDDYDADVATTEDPDVIVMYANRLTRARGDCLRRTNGIVIDNTITAAILMTVGHLYRNRQDVVAGQAAAAVQMPVGAQRVLQPYLWIGELGSAE